MKLNFNFDGKTFLSKWWKIVRDNFTAIQTEHNTLSNKLDTEITLFRTKNEVTQCTDEYHHSTRTACFFNTKITINYD